MSEFFVFPRMSSALARVRLEELASLSLREVRSRTSKISDLNHATWRPTGAHVKVEELSRFQDEVRALADEFGFPDSEKVAESTSDQLTPGFDERLISLFEEQLPSMTPAEAGHLGVWLFITAQILPDVALWRWRWKHPTADQPTPENGRLLSKRRNMFGYAWRHAHLLGSSLTNRLDKDARLNIIERPGLFHDRIFVRRFATALASELDSAGQARDRTRSRESIKRLFRLTGIVDHSTLPPEEVDVLIHEAIHGKTAKVADAPARGLQRFVESVAQHGISVDKYLVPSPAGSAVVQTLGVGVSEMVRSYAASPTASKAGILCLETLRLWDSVDADGRRIAIAACLYFLDPGDYKPDKEDSGFEDDLIVAEHALEAMKLTLLE